MNQPPRILRTPDDRFSQLPGYPFTPHYVQVPDSTLGALRMHYIDEGPRDAPVALMLHGEPTWSFLYRKMIGPVTAAGFRAIAPDCIGFGRSDKPTQRDDYSYRRHVDWLRALVEQLDLKRITLMCQDWGGPLGLQLLAAMPQRFVAVLAANTLLPNCEAPPRGVDGWPGKAIEDWERTTAKATELPIGQIVAGVCVTRPADDVIAAYDAPFPEPAYQAGALEFPSLIPFTENAPGIVENRRVWDMLEGFDRPFRTAFSDGDPTTRAWETVFRERVAGARGQAHAEIAGAGHFLQEERGEALAEVLLDLMQEANGKQ